MFLILKRKMSIKHINHMKGSEEHLNEEIWVIDYFKSKIIPSAKM